MAEEVTSPEGSSAPAGIENPVDRLAARWNERDAAPAQKSEVVNESTEETVMEDSQTEEESTSEEGLDDVIYEGEPEEVPTEEEAEAGEYFTSLDQLVDAVGYDKNTFMSNLKIPVRMEDGRVVERNFHEVVQGYQRGSRHKEQMDALEGRNKELQEKASKIDAEFQSRLGAVTQAMDMATRVLEGQEKAVKEYYDSLDWAKMRQENESLYAATRTDYDRALAKVKEDREKLFQEHKTLYEGQAKESAIKFNAWKAEQQQKLISRRSEWADPDARAKAGAKIGQYLINEYGSTPEEVANLYDHRMLDITYKAMLWDEAQAKGGSLPLKKGKVAVLRPGAKRKLTGAAATEKMRGVKAEMAARKRLSESHTQADGAAALAARWARTGRNQ